MIALMVGGLAVLLQSSPVLRSSDAIDANAPVVAWSELDQGYLKRLRDEFELERIVAHAESDYDKIMSVCQWVRSRWEHNGSNEPTKPDPISILHEAARGKQFRCVEYAVVLSGALNALDIRARVLALKTADVETRPSGAGHVVTEAFLGDLGKWIMVDGQWDVIPMHDGVALNALELGQALARGDELDVDGLGATTREQYLPWIAPYLYYLDYNLRNPIAAANAQDRGLMLLPPGAKAPSVFQQKWPLDYLATTTSAKSFYAAPIEIAALARAVVGDATAALDRAARVIEWTTHHLTWTATDYQSRSVEAILARQGGNCSEQTMVVRALLSRAGVATRRIAEINLQPESARRQRDAEELMRSRGARGSVFGLRHNDHRWIEVHDTATGAWVPADATLGLLGVDAWLAARVAFGARPVHAILPARDMLVPFAIFAVDDAESTILEDRTEYYLVERFGAFLPRLRESPAWQPWCDTIGALRTASRDALLGKTSLHEHGTSIARLAQVYESLKAWSAPHPQGAR